MYLSPEEGVGNAGCQRTRSRACSVESTRVSHHGCAGNTRHSRTRVVLTVSFVISSAIGLVCHRHWRELLPANLTPASRRQDHTTSPSASSAVRQKRISVHRIQPRVRDDRDTPLCGVDGGSYETDLRETKREKFFESGLDRHFAKQPDGQISRIVRGISGHARRQRARRHAAPEPCARRDR